MSSSSIQFNIDEIIKKAGKGGDFDVKVCTSSLAGRRALQGFEKIGEFNNLGEQLVVMARAKPKPPPKPVAAKPAPTPAPKPPVAKTAPKKETTSEPKRGFFGQQLRPDPQPKGTTPAGGKTRS